MGSHNIVGCEAIDDHRKRLVAFSHAHGSIVELPRARRARLAHLLTFAAGVVLALALTALLIARP